MTFTKKQASIAAAGASIIIAALGGIQAGAMAALGFFILLTL
jgi:hypothetical protein